MFKYIIFEDSTGLPKLIIFDCITDHVAVKNRFENFKLVSAGKISFNFGKEEWNCQSGSLTLGIKTNQTQSSEDLKTIKKLSELY